jgi:hypothetical protein
MSPLPCTPPAAQGAYILNVVVHEDHRGQGIGRQLMQAAMRRAVQRWEAPALYTHVEASNEVRWGCCLGNHDIRMAEGGQHVPSFQKAMSASLLFVTSASRNHHMTTLTSDTFWGRACSYLHTHTALAFEICSFVHS